MSERKVDLIVLGAGTAGCLASYTAAKSGLENIALIDRKSKDKIGKKVCGDGIGTKHLQFLKEKGLPITEQEIIHNRSKTAHLISPDEEKDYALDIKGQLAIIHRHKLGQSLLKGAIDQGVQLFENTRFKTLKREKDLVKVYCSKKEADSSIFKAPLIIDATGINSHIRENSNIFEKFAQLKDDEQYYCYREICKLKKFPKTYLDSAVFKFSNEITKGGYMWFFHRENREFNLGTGIPKSWSKKLSPKTIYHKHMLSQVQREEVLEFGGGFVPTRHPLPSHVKDNIILIGDAGLIVNPLHGGGLGSSIASGYISGKIAAKQIPTEAVKEEDLWPFNQQLLERYGRRYSILDLYRILLQNLPDKELNKAFKEGYLPLGKIFYAREYNLLMKLSRKLGEIWKELPSKRFHLLPNYLERIDNLTKSYPTSPKELIPWAQNYEQMYLDYQSKIRLME